eukprot:500847-Amphidinium_carterae.1
MPLDSLQTQEEGHVQLRSLRPCMCSGQLGRFLLERRTETANITIADITFELFCVVLPKPPTKVFLELSI